MTYFLTRDDLENTLKLILHLFWRLVFICPRATQVLTAIVICQFQNKTFSKPEKINSYTFLCINKFTEPTFVCLRHHSIVYINFFWQIGNSTWWCFRKWYLSSVNALSREYSLPYTHHIFWKLYFFRWAILKNEI